MKEVTNPEKLKELNALFGNKDSDEIRWCRNYRS